MEQEGQAEQGRWFQDVWFVLAMLFLVLGPLGLPLLWKSPRFARWAKILLTIAVLLYTIWILRMAGTVFRHALDQLRRSGVSLEIHS